MSGGREHPAAIREIVRERYAAGFAEIEIRETHRVHEHPAAAIVRAVKPERACCSTATLASCCEPSAKAGCCGGASTEAPTSCGCTPG